MAYKWDPKKGKEPPKAREVKKITRKKIKVTGQKKPKPGAWGL